jgi:hypothetical protein
MKKVLVFSLMFMFLALTGMESASAAVGGNIHFGKPSKGCTGFGICSFYFEAFGISISYGERGGKDGITAQSSIDESKNTFTLTFSINELKQKDPTKAAGLDREQFELEEDITLSKDANQMYKLKRSTPIVLKKGSYPIRKSGDTATVVIDIR